MITLTEAARKRFLEVVEAEGRQGQGLRISVRNGRTASPEYALNFVELDTAADDDVVEDLGQLKIYMDPQSAKFLEDASIDFVETLEESGFKIEAPNVGVPEASGPVAEAVKAILEQEINPAVAMHGGHVSLVAVEDGTAYLRFGGGCQGCGMVNVTLKQGVEKVMFEKVPEITRVMDVTDHAAGANPYYQPAK